MTGRNKAMVGKSDGSKRLSVHFLLSHSFPNTPTHGMVQPTSRAGPLLSALLSRSMLTDTPNVCLTDVLDLKFTGKINQHSIGYERYGCLLVPLNTRSLHSQTIKQKVAQQHLVPQTLGQTHLATAFALTGATIPYPGLMVGTLEEPPLPSEFLVLGSLHALPCLLG